MIRKPMLLRPGLRLMIVCLVGLSAAPLADQAWADHLPPGIRVIHLRTPAYLEKPVGSTHYTDEDIAQATELAKLGDAEAESNLGVMLASRGDYQKAAYWYRNAAITGIATAAYNLGTLYFNGQGFKQDYTTARKWFELAAKRDNAYAEFQLGLMYYTGQGAEKDPAKELFWYQKAASHGLPAAQYNLAVMYHNGDDAQHDELLAYAWILLAQKGGLDKIGRASCRERV